MDWLVDPQAWIAFLTLVALEIVLGVDNIIFISILAGKLPASQQKRARNVGLALALVMRVILLFSLSWVIALTAPLLIVWGQEISGRDLILLLGGLFLLAKARLEIHENLKGEPGHACEGDGDVYQRHCAVELVELSRVRETAIVCLTRADHPMALGASHH